MKSKIPIVFLDAASVDLGDVSLAALKQQGVYQGYPVTSSKHILSRAQKAVVLIVNKYPLKAPLLSKLSHLKLICVAATGVNNVDLKACQSLGIGVCNVAGYSTSSVAEHTLLFLLALSHRLVPHHEASFRGDWSRSSHFALLDYPYSELEGKTLGIVGYGHIGRRVTFLAKGLGMKVLVAALPGRKYADGKIERKSLKMVLKQSDYVSLHCPLSRQTYHLIGKTELALMKKEACLLNLARGPLVDEIAVARALSGKTLRAYATDVLQEEPPSLKHPLLTPKLKDSVLITPHVAWAGVKSRQKLMDEIAANIAAFKQGKKRNRLV